jgi:hypothetical protein
MKKLTLEKKRSQQQGFIPMMLSILGVIALIIYLVFIRVVKVNS